MMNKWQRPDEQLLKKAIARLEVVFPTARSDSWLSVFMGYLEFLLALSQRWRDGNPVLTAQETELLADICMGAPWGPLEGFGIKDNADSSLGDLLCRATDEARKMAGALGVHFRLLR